MYQRIDQRSQDIYKSLYIKIKKAKKFIKISQDREKLREAKKFMEGFLQNISN